MPTGRKERPPWRNRERKPARNWPPRLRTERRKSGSLKTGKRCCGKLYALSTAVGVFCHKQRLFLWTPFEQNEPPDAQKGFICITIRVICQKRARRTPHRRSMQSAECSSWSVRYVRRNEKRGRYAGHSLCSGLFLPYANVLTEYVIF